jgi:hypothetical protein
MTDTTQPSLFPMPEEPDKNRLGPFHANGQDTERLAALDNYVRSGSQRRQVLLALDDAGDEGCTDYELFQRTSVSRMHVAGTRRKELQDRDLVDKSDLAHRETDTGSKAIVWIITPEGHAAAGRIRAST